MSARTTDVFLAVRYSAFCKSSLKSQRKSWRSMPRSRRLKRKLAAAASRFVSSALRESPENEQRTKRQQCV